MDWTLVSISDYTVDFRNSKIYLYIIELVSFLMSPHPIAWVALYRLCSAFRDRLSDEPPVIEMVELGSLSVSDHGAVRCPVSVPPSVPVIERHVEGYLSPRDLRPHRAQRRADGHHLRPGTPALPARGLGHHNLGLDIEDHFYEEIEFEPPGLLKATEDLASALDVALVPAPFIRESGEEERGK